MFGQPRYHNYPPNVSYNPYLHSSYQRPSPFEPIPVRGRALDQERVMQDQARALAEQRARRSQYLPDEDEDEDEDDWEYNQLGPRERAYVDAKRWQAILEREQQQERLKRQVALEERRRKALALEEQRQKEAQARQRSLEEQAAEREKRIQQQRQQHRSTSRGPQQAVPLARHEEEPVPVHTRPATLPRADAQAVPQQTSRPVTPPSKPARTIEEQNAAASQIQQRYRIYSSSRALGKLASQFDNAKKSFVYPRVIDFKKPGSEDSHISVPACRPPSDFDDDVEEPMDVDGPSGKLAYTSTNYVLNQYADALVKLLMKLDGVESWGDKGLRMKRREVVKEIEKEASKIERYWRQAWVDYMAKQGSEKEQKDGGESGKGSIQ